MNWTDHITVDANVCHGNACIKGTRIMVSVVLDNLAAGLSIEDILRSYPSLKRDSILAATSYAAECIKSENAAIRMLFKNLITQKRFEFPKKGKPSTVPCAHGVYIIRKENKVLHVGRTLRGKKGLPQRLCNHLHRESSFVKKYLGGNGNRLRHKGYTYQYLEVKSDAQRALLEAYAIGILCPKHLGLGN